MDMHFDHIHVVWNERKYSYKILAWNGEKLFYMYVFDGETMDDVYKRERYVNPAYRGRRTELDHAEFVYKAIVARIADSLISRIKGGS